jgi:hypothetical protein
MVRAILSPCTTIHHSTADNDQEESALPAKINPMEWR